jgi:tetratricopeptide (TPR) repeat protein/ferredoxin
MKSNCTQPGAPAAALQPGTRIRKSRAGKWRALVLVLVTLAMVGHIVHWKVAGETLTPLEPSESMEFSKRGVVNAGFVFFAIMIGSTLIVGRWFCGWACHFVALQDAAGWLLKKLHLRPRHVDLGILGWVPWLAAVYMFLQLIAERLMTGIGLAESTTHFTTENFWATFPNWLTAVATFGIAGFAIVWFLGSKGFCYYGCPYGGVFGVVDQLAPVRIRVTDACSGCGHCTAVCTSNVRVHEEVRDWKAVVDPGCMKCLDCVSVCPNDALYVGFGMPALFAKRATPKPAPQPVPKRTDRGPLVQFLLTACFFFAAISAFLASNPGGSNFQLPLALVLTGFALVVALPFGGRAAQKRHEYTLGEECLLAVAFVVAVFGFRDQHIPIGLPGAPTLDFPFLFSMGLAAIFAFALLQLVRLLTRANLSLQSLALRAAGRMRPAGIAFASCVLPIVALVSWRATVHASEVIAEHAQRLTPEEEAQRQQRVLDLCARALVAANANDFVAAEKGFREALELLPGYIPARENLAGMLCAQNRFAEGIEQYRIALRTNTRDADTWAFLARAQLGLEDLAGARASLEEALAIAPERAELHAFLADVCEAQRDAACAAEHRRRAQELSAPAPR